MFGLDKVWSGLRDGSCRIWREGDGGREKERDNLLNREFKVDINFFFKEVYLIIRGKKLKRVIGVEKIK